MSEASNITRCNCCNEVMEELLSMRICFEKLFHRLKKEILGLRREVIGALESKSPLKVTHEPKAASKVLKSALQDPAAVPSEEAVPTIDLNISDTDNESVKSKKIKKSAATKSSTNPRKIERVGPDVSYVASTARPVLDFYNIQARVMPTQQFRDAQQFEDWNILLRNDEDQRDQLRVELMQGNYKEPEKYITQTWRNIFHNDAAHHYSYRGTGRDKRAIKDYIFTDIFKEIFLQRFYHMDVEFFIDRTMRFFKYVRDQRRKAALKQRKLQEKDAAPEAENEVLQESMDDE
ncbi:uncharacterized protein LOC129243992 [Anastrepha obliqua]|uniref:uncharacterized protein LOC129243992 n=1 Tax=Anastrepha obliqua TaxID=95512 RepID=UPI0024096FDD|nr:uncharacterized protein LOC129243992 [Anastrepha obliqua]XP_054737517.1 uncharacterized protein LOC129243992 [Anastrepha obliqua]